MAVTKFERSLIETEALRPRILPQFRSLFDHLIDMAKHSHKNYPKRAGQELAHARKLLKHGEAKR
jgi:hypothetical protein